LLSITIHQIVGQEIFTPTMTLIGPGLPSGDLPKQVIKPENAGIMILLPPANATPFFEPSAEHLIGLAKNKMSPCPPMATMLLLSGMMKGRQGVILRDPQ
jgi:hypothetical protein